MHTQRSTPTEVALLTKLERLPVNTHKTQRLRRFDFSRSSVLSWYHGVVRSGRHYSMRCDVAKDGSLEVSFNPASPRKTR